MFETDAIIPPFPLGETSLLATRLKALVKKTGFQQFSEETGISRAQLNRYLNGKPIPSDRLERIIAFTDVSPNWLFQGHPDSPRRASLHDYERLQHITAMLFQTLSHAQLNRPFTPNELQYILPLFRLNDHSLAQQGQQDLITEFYILSALYFIDGLRSQNGLELYLRAIKQWIMHPTLPLSHEDAARISSLISISHQHYYNSPLGIRQLEQMQHPLTLAEKTLITTFIDHYIVANGIKSRRKLLDLGCGNARQLVFLHNHYELLDIYGVDNASHSINIGHQYIKKNKLTPNTIFEASATNLPFPNESLDLVLCHHLLHHFPFISCSLEHGVGKVLSEISRVLSPGGIVQCVLPSKPKASYLPIFNVTVPTSSLVSLAKEANLNLYTFNTPDPAEVPESVVIYLHKR